MRQDGQQRMHSQNRVKIKKLLLETLVERSQITPLAKILKKIDALTFNILR